MSITILPSILLALLAGAQVQASRFTTVRTTRSALTTTVNHTKTIPSTTTFIGYLWYETYCEYDTILLKRLYEQQTTPAYSYPHLCWFRFVELFKLNNTGEMLLFGSLFADVNGAKHTENLFRLPEQVSFFGDNIKYINFRIVIRFDVYFANHTNSSILPITVGNETFMVHLTSHKYEYLLPKTFQYNSNFNKTVVIPHGVQSHVKDSYLMVCVNIHYGNGICNLEIKGNKIECYCPENQLGYVVVIIFFIFAWPIIMFLVSYSCTCDIEAQPQAQVNSILCIAGESTHEYLVIFHIGPATDGFDFTSSHLDIQLLTNENDPVGIPIRFSASKLTDPLCSELHMFVLRISPMPMITALLVNHSSAGNLIYLYDLIVVDLRQNNSVVQVEVINRFITPESKHIRLLPVSVIEKLNPRLEKAMKKRSTTKRNQFSWMPISLTELTSCERVSFSALLLGADSVTVMCARLYLHCYEFWKDWRHSWLQFATCLTSATLVGWLMLGVLEWVYVVFIKRYYIIERLVQITSPVTFAPYWMLRMIWLFLLHAICFSLYAYTISLSIKLDMVSAALWSGMTLSILVLTLGMWNLADEAVFAHLRIARAKIDYVSMVSEKGTWTPTAIKRNSSVSCRFSTLTGGALSEVLTRHPTTETFGPKLVNPHLAPSNSNLLLKPKSRNEPSKSSSVSISKSRSKVFSQKRPYSLQKSSHKSQISIPMTTKQVGKQSNLSKNKVALGKAKKSKEEHSEQKQQSQNFLL